MHFSTIVPTALCLATSTLASPFASSGKHEYSPTVKANVTATIYEWLSDIERVNFFVDTVTKETDFKIISSMAAAALPAAMNEGTSNSILLSEVALDASGEAASKALPASFSIIGPAINDTIYQPQNVKKKVAAVNGQRWDLSVVSLSDTCLLNAWFSDVLLRKELVPLLRRAMSSKQQRQP